MNTHYHFTITKEQLKHLEAKQNQRYTKLDNLLKNTNFVKYHGGNIPKRLSIREQVDFINLHINEVLRNITPNDFLAIPKDMTSIEFIDYCDKHYFRFDSLTGELMNKGWEVETNAGEKLFLSGQQNGKVHDSQIKRVNDAVLKYFNMSLKDMMSCKFGISADWKQFA